MAVIYKHHLYIHHSIHWNE